MIYTHTNVFKIVDRKAFEELRNDFRNVNFKINNNFVSFESYFKPEFDSNFYSKLQSGDKSLRQISKKTNEFSVSDFDAFAKLAKGLFADYNNGVDVPDEYRIRKFKRKSFYLNANPENMQARNIKRV